MANQPKGPKGSSKAGGGSSTGSSKSERASRRAEVAAELRRQQAREQRRSRLIMASSVVIAIVIVVGAVVAIGLNHGPKSGKASSVAPAAVVKAVTGVPSTVFDQIGAGTADNPPAPIKGGSAMTQDGKPRVLYVGAEYCPYCAADRWGLVAALSRFGTFKNLGVTHSASGDVYANTPTLSFHGSSYTSKYLVFKGYEKQSNKISGGSYASLDSLSSADEKVFDTYDNPPYVQSSAAGTIPFIDWGGLYLTSGASYLPTMLAGKTHLQVAQSLSDPSSAAAKAIDGTANVFSAMICKLTKGQPANVCTSSGVTAAASKIK